MQKSRRIRCLHHVAVFLGGIDTDMVLIYRDLCGREVVLPCDHIRKLFPAILSEFGCKLFLGKVMVDPFGRKILHILGPLALWLFPAGLFQIFRLFGIQVAHCFRLIEEDDVPVYFHEADLVYVLHLFGRTPEAVLLAKHHLLEDLLDLLVQVVDLFGQLFHLFLLVQEHLYQKTSVHAVQLFFRIFDRHSKDLSNWSLL